MIAKELDPIASRIPLPLWNQLFKDGLGSEAVQLNNKPFEVLRKGDLPVDKSKALVVLLAAYPQASAEQLYDFALDELQLPFKEIVSMGAAMGQLALLKHLKDQEPKAFKRAVVDVLYRVCSLAATNGQMTTFNWIIDSYFTLKYVHQNEMHEVLKDAFRSAITVGDINFLEQFKKGLSLTPMDRMIGLFLGQGTKPAPEKMKQLIKSDKFHNFRLACVLGKLDAMEWMRKQFNDEFGAMLHATVNLSLTKIVEKGQLDVLKWLEKETAGYWFKAEFSKVLQQYCFPLAFQMGHMEVCVWLLKYPAVLSFAERHSEDYGRLLLPFVQDSIASLREAKRQFVREHPNGVFDLQDPQAAKKCFYLLRNLIRRSSRAPSTLYDDFLFLLDIPAVKALVHRSETEGESNDLLRLAQRVGNQRVCAVLLTIPAVRLLAEHNHYYQDEYSGRLNLQSLADDNESSMKVLTTGEQKRLAKVLEHYEPQLQRAGGVKQVMGALRDTLSKRFMEKPAECKLDDGTTCSLPLLYSDFTRLHLSPAEKARALRAYYQHKDHSALRYISKPNHWMHPKASYVYINDQRTERWSTFESYQPLIANFYLAASDKDSPAIGGHTIDGRLDHFIDEIAHIGRAHNWDSYRAKTDSAGKIRKDAKGNPLKEQYDDLEGDRPSCVSGVKRRLFQSVVGHPLITLLDSTLVQQHLIDAVRAHYKKVFTHEHQAALDVALECTTDGDAIPEAEYTLLSSINLSQEIVDTFLLDLELKYGETATDFAPEISKQLELPANNEEPSMRRTHILAFYTKAHLDQLVGELKAEKRTQNTFFKDNSTDVYRMASLTELDDPDVYSANDSSQDDVLEGTVLQW